MESVSTETNDSIINEVGGTSVFLFEGYDTCAWMGVLCSIYRIEACIQFTYTIFKLIDEKGVCMDAMVLTIDKSSIRWLGDGAFCCFFGRLYGFVC